LLELVLLLFVIRLLLWFEPPELIGERKIRKDERELLDVTVFEELRVSNRAGTSLDVGFKPVEHGIDLADGGVSPVHLLREITSASRVMSMLPQIVRCVHQHAARAGGRVVNGIPRVRFEDANERVHHLRWSEEFSCLCASVICE